MSCSTCSNKGFVVPNVRQSVNGVIGLTKLVAGQTATEDVIATRRNECRNCEFATRNLKMKDNPSKGLTSYSQCTKCACVIKYKTQVKDEKCPLDKW